ncbi:hypothetical protein K457DRAFT_787550 [Linnemannia elongata AG-77]|uniref:Uncharacterized protein n=1 Tax=Linnemannia elongata AG-77 TaxID=1314771 RepID=A0A197JKW4_9FUNG|nr:hypothetical protein K457DRAFT_787550 [Linnemannia elongata AG-77]
MNGLQDANTRMELTDRNFCTSDDTQYFHKQTGIATSSRQGVTMSNTNTNNKHRKHNKTTSSCQGLWKRIKEKIRPTHNIHWNCLGPVFFFFLQLLKKRHTDLVFLCVFIFTFFFFCFCFAAGKFVALPILFFFSISVICFCSVCRVILLRPLVTLFSFVTNCEAIIFLLFFFLVVHHHLVQ